MSAEVAAQAVAGQDELLDREALDLVAELQTRFGARRLALLAARDEREARFAAGERPEFPAETRDLREAEWTVASAPPDLDDRRVELTGPAEAKMVINALNSGASVFMCCLEDALSPTWANVVGGHVAVRDATRRTLEFSSPEGKRYTLGEQLATLVVRPRGWHLEERHVLVGGRPVSASLFDIALFLRWNGLASVARGSGPYVYLAKLESRHEAELWNDVFIAAQEAVGLPRGTIRATVLIETITASFEMEEILYALREHSAGLNAGRWDYIFSAIKKFRDDPAFVLPDRSAVTMAVPFMHAYTEQLVRACHRRGAHAIGGMAAFIPSRDATFNEQAFARVREDKEREAGQGFDGSWVAHPGLVPLAREIFDAVLGDRPNQKTRLREDVTPDGAALLALDRTPGAITLAGVQTNVSVGLRYLDSWLSGVGAAAIDNLMEDAATAEISRAQLWQWIRHACTTSEGETITPELYARERDTVLARLAGDGRAHLAEAAEILDGLVLDEGFAPFLTLRAGRLLP
ncbi:MAG: malate synthase [Gaiellales bacterium]|nr:malate synthase [Gaiellales bacterium]